MIKVFISIIKATNMMICAPYTRYVNDIKMRKKYKIFVIGADFDEL